MSKNGEWKVFIQSNKSQRLGAQLSKYSINKVSPGIPVEILNVEEIQEFQQFVGSSYKQGSETRHYSLEDEQSFTLSRFLPPQKMEYAGRSLVIDPDVFAVSDIRSLFSLQTAGSPIACCKRTEGGFWDTSVMLLENKALDWNMGEILKDLSNQKYNYNFAIRQLFDLPVYELPRIWNQLDELQSGTKLVHYTRQRTQPWKTGLPYTVTKRKLGKILGVIPKEWLLGSRKYPSTYQEHPDNHVRTFFFTLLGNALRDGAVSSQQIHSHIEQGSIRPDLLEELHAYE